MPKERTKKKRRKKEKERKVLCKTSIYFSPMIMNNFLLY